MIESVQPFITQIGTLLELAAALLLGGLFLLLRRYARRRRYFGVWSGAWFALAACIGALVLFDLGIAIVPPPVLLFLHQLGYLAFIALLVAGTRFYARGAPFTPFVPVSIGLSAAYSLISLQATSDPAGLIAWHAPVAMLALGWCGARMLLLPRSRHAVGSRLTGGVFTGMAGLAALEALTFGWSGVPAGLLRIGLLHHYGDVLAHMLLGAGMIVLLMEDAKREVDDAHAELAVAHDELRRAALYDTVTGTLNRRAFVEGIGLELARARYGAVLMLDIDDMKTVNDAFGHSAGDALLRYVSDTVRSKLRPSDKVYRWGGDEFLLVLPGADADRAQNRVRSIIAAAPPLRLEPSEHEVPLRVSTGTFAYTSGEMLAEAINAADAAMYQEKSRRKLLRGTGSPAA